MPDISFDVAAGQTAALVGRTGAGKTTIANLIPRFHDVSRQLAIVLQEPFLFGGTIADNIAYGRPGASPAKIRAAAEAVGAHATFMRQLATDLLDDVGLTLGDFDVLAQLGQAGGQMRISELAAQAYSSRLGMTRRIDRLVDEGLVTRANADADGRGVVVELTDAGVARLMEAMPVHLHRVRQLFVERLSDEELCILARALEKVAVDCGFG